MGANIGFYSIAFANRLKKLERGRIFAFEPILHNYRRLQENIALNGFQNIIIPFPLALGDVEKECTMIFDARHKATTGNAALVMGSIDPVQGPQVEKEKQIVTMKRLDEVAEKLEIDHCSFIKLDIEGAEVFFLRGAKSFIEKNRPIIFGEFNHWWMEQYGVSYEEAGDLLIPLGYIFYQYQKGKFYKQTTPFGENLLLLPSSECKKVSAKLGRIFRSI
ncbi:MAG: FkbM family methyltransferase [Candidatus Omnitrophica bacterium]|nr:FkbM family methyltransferase [Candidatus Omnitrophota bacterium]